MKDVTENDFLKAVDEVRAYFNSSVGNKSLLESLVRAVEIMEDNGQEFLIIHIVALLISQDVIKIN